MNFTGCKKNVGTATRMFFGRIPKIIKFKNSMLQKKLNKFTFFIHVGKFVARKKGKPDNFHLFSSFQPVVWAQSVDPLPTADPKCRISRFLFWKYPGKQ